MVEEQAIPLTVIGGFLGSGKTTLVNRLLQDAEDERFAVLVNDFGALNIDAALISSASDDVIELANGCVCCTIGDSLVDTLFALFERPEKPGHILIEASGVADPARIAEVAELDTRLSLNGVVILIDARRFRRQLDDDRLEDTLERQIQSADLFVVNKCDEAGEAATDKVCSQLSTRHPGVPSLRAVAADVPKPFVLEAVRVPKKNQGHRHDHPDHPFWTYAIELEGSFEPTALEGFAANLPGTVRRAKGIFCLSGSTDRMAVLQAVDGTSTVSLEGALPGLKSNRLVLIGQGEPPEKDTIEAMLAAQLA